MNHFKRCAFLTMENTAGFFVEDSRTFAPLEELGWAVEEIPWNRPSVNWSDFQVVVIRSTWDYQNSPDRFLATLRQIDASDAILLNPLAICVWNLEKTYLKQLQEKGIPVVPTIWLDYLDEPRLNEVFSRLNCRQLVVKPVIGANADDTFALDVDSTNLKAAACATFSNKRLMAQPFLESIVNEGEYSLFFFGGQFSHAILKTPKPNDFRVQEEHGGTIRAVDPAFELMEVAQRTIGAIEEELLYARVDLVRLSDGTPAVIELELIEPSLYFSYSETAASAFALALERIVKAETTNEKRS